MTDLAQPRMNMPRAPVRLAPQDETYLPLSGAGPFTVDVKIANDGSAEVALPSGGTTYTDLSWQYPKGTSSTTITFVFINSPSGTITDLTSDTAGLSFATASSTQQVGTVTATSTTYRFGVTYTSPSDGLLRKVTVDPQIVVTPQ